MEGEVVSSFRESVHIDAPPEVVWRLVSDVRRHPAFAGPKSITKAIDIDGDLEVGRRWIAHERFGPQKFDAPSDEAARRQLVAAGYRIQLDIDVVARRVHTGGAIVMGRRHVDGFAFAAPQRQSPFYDVAAVRDPARPH